MADLVRATRDANWALAQRYKAERDRLREALSDLLRDRQESQMHPEDTWPCGRFEVYDAEGDRLNGFHRREEAEACAARFPGATVFDRADRFSYAPTDVLLRPTDTLRPGTHDDVHTERYAGSHEERTDRPTDPAAAEGHVAERGEPPRPRPL